MASRTKLNQNSIEKLYNPDSFKGYKLNMKAVGGQSK